MIKGILSALAAIFIIPSAFSQNEWKAVTSDSLWQRKDSEARLTGRMVNARALGTEGRVYITTKKGDVVTADANRYTLSCIEGFVANWKLKLRQPNYYVEEWTYPSPPKRGESPGSIMGWEHFEGKKNDLLEDPIPTKRIRTAEYIEENGIIRTIPLNPPGSRESSCKMLSALPIKETKEIKKEKEEEEKNEKKGEPVALKR